MPLSYARALLVVAGLLAPVSIHARTWTHLDHPATLPAAQGVLSYARTHAERFGARDPGSIHVEREIPLRGGSVVKLVQRVNGQRVLNRGLSVLVLGDRIVAASGALGPSRAPEPARLTSAQAEQSILRLWPGARVRHATEGLWALAQGLRPAWALDLVTARPFGVWRVVLDAADGHVLSSASRLIPAKGQAYTTNPAVGSLTQVEIEGLLQPAELKGELADARTCTLDFTSYEVTCSRHAVPDTAGDFIYQPDEPSVTDPFSEVQGYVHADTFHRWLAQRFGFARTGPSQQISVMVNFQFQSEDGQTEGMYNAFFGDIDGDVKGEIVFGQGQRDFAYDADVIYHEFTHSVVDETSNLEANVDALGFNLMPLALNEGFADYFSSAFSGDPKVGEYAGNGAIRNLSGSSSCPKNLTGESHEDGLIWGRTTWGIRTKVKDADAFDEAMYKTLVALSEEAGISDAAAMLLQVAGLADPAMAQIVQSELTAKGLTDCSRIVALAEDQPMGGYMMEAAMAPGMGMMPAAMQYRIDVPQNAVQLWIEAGSSHSHPGHTPSVGAYIRKGEPVSFAGSKSTFDFVKLNTEAGITLERTSKDKPLDPGASYFVLPLNVGQRAATYQIAYDLTLDPSSTPDASLPSTPDAMSLGADGGTIPADPTETPRGCSCEIGGESPEMGGLLLIALVAFGLAWRRRASWTSPQ